VKPTVVQALEGIFVSQITCGWSHSVALTSKGRVYVSIALLSCMCRSCSSFSHNT
jgi:RCC1 and BTB domain-containing protein